MNMNRFPDKQEYNKYTMNTMVSRLVILCILAMSLNCYAAPPPSPNTCKSRWTINNVTAGMYFGDFTIESGTGTIDLNAGSTRSGGGNIDLVNAGSAVSTHQIQISNSLGTALCADFGVTISVVPTPALMSGAGNDIPISNVLVDIPGEPGTPFTPPFTYTAVAGAPENLMVEIISRMSASSPQSSGLYQSAGYAFSLTQSGTTTSVNGVVEALAITPLTLTSGVAMDFGEVASGLAGGTIVLNTSGARSVGSGDVDIIGDSTSGVPGTFTVQGDAGLAFSISYANGALTDSGGGNSIIISSFTDTAAALTLTGNADPFSVGATLTLTGSQPEGNYSTANPGGVPYVVTVNYN